MGDTNYVGSIVKILENPIQKIFSDTIISTEFRVQLPQIRNRQNRIVNLVFWGNLAVDVKKYYRINDYIIIEGYLSLREEKLKKFTNSNLKKIQIVCFKAYPFSIKKF